MPLLLICPGLFLPAALVAQATRAVLQRGWRQVLSVTVVMLPGLGALLWYLAGPEQALIGLAILLGLPAGAIIGLALNFLHMPGLAFGAGLRGRSDRSLRKSVVRRV